MKRATCLLTCAVLLGGVDSATAGPIQNGGFEAGNLSGWTVSNRPSNSPFVLGNWFASGSTTSPLSANPTPGPNSGGFFALTDQINPGTHALTQSFTVAPGGNYHLSFDMFINDYGLGPRFAGGTSDLDFTTMQPNQHVRVDLLTATATPFDTSSGVVENLFRSSTQAPATGTNPWVHYDFDISSAVGSGGTFQVRFAEVDNVNYLLLGVDNVSISQASVIPEPTSWLLFGLTAATAGGYFTWRRKQQVSA